MLHPGTGTGEGLAGELGVVTEVAMARLQLKVEEILISWWVGG
jgi:hypothetical protein